MATVNPFDLLGGDDNDDPAQLLAAAAAAAQKAEAKKPAAAAAAAAAGKAAQPADAAKFPAKPPPPAQTVRDARAGGAPSRGGFGRGERGRGRGGRGYGQNRAFGNDNANGFVGGYGSGGGSVTGGGAAGEEGARDRERGERGPRPPFHGGQRGGYRDGEFGDESERRPRRMYERHSGTGRGYEMKREGAGRGNWGTATDEMLAQETDEALKVEEKAPIAEKQGEQGDAPAAEDSKDTKDAAPNEEEKEEDKEMTLEEFEKLREEKRKALLALKTEERKVEIDMDLQSMQVLSTKKGNDDVFIKLGSDKDALKKKESAERAKKSLSINEFLKPAEGGRYYGGAGGRGRGRGRGERGGYRGGFGGGYRSPAAAPSIEDQAQFPTLGGK